MTRRKLALPLFLVFACGCSPVYVYKSAAGHAKFLWRRQSVEKTAADPRTSPELRKKLELISEIRAFAFDRVSLARSKDYSTFSRIDGPVLTYLVTGSEKTRFKPYVWKFPLVGSFPYQGHFDKKDALREKSRLESRGYDASLGGVGAYRVPLFSNALPSTALDDTPGELAELIIHELTHGTVFFKGDIGFDESLATFVGDQGAREFLESRYGAGSPELAGFERALGRQRELTAVFDELHAELEALYGGGAAEAEKLARREEVFRKGEARLKGLGFAFDGPLNNAVILAHRLYHKDLDRFRTAYERHGRDWAKTIEFFRALDEKDPSEDLRRKLSAG